MPLTMDDDGAILVHLTNPGGIVGGSGVANQITYWTDTDTISGDAGLTYDAATDTITIAGNILMADDHFVGITGDIRIEFDSSDGDIMFHLGDAAGADQVQIVDSGSNIVAYVDSDGNAEFKKHVGMGSGGVVQPNIILFVRETPTSLVGYEYALVFDLLFAPAADFATTVYGAQGQVTVTTAHARTGGQICGVVGAANVADTIAPTGLIMWGGYFTTDIEDGAALTAGGARIYTPFLDTGSVTNAYGLRITQGTVGAGTITTLYGLRIENIAAGNTNYAIYSDGVNSHSYHAGKVSIGGTVAPLAQLHVDQSSASGAIPVLLLDQGDVSEQHIICSMNGADQDFPAIIELDVTGSPKLWWDESDDTFVFTHSLAIGGLNNELRFYEGVNYVGFEAPALAADQIWVLPIADGNVNDHLRTDGAGTLSWVAPGGGGIAGKIWLGAVGGWPSTTNGCAAANKTEYVTNDVDMYSLDFDTATDEFAQWSLAMPSDWDAGTITAVFYWTAASGSGTVCFALQGRSYGDSDAIDQAFGTAQTATDTLITAADVHISVATAAITVVGAGASELVQFRAYRDVSGDTLGVDAKLLGVMVTFTRS